MNNTDNNNLYGINSETIGNRAASEFQSTVIPPVSDVLNIEETFTGTFTLLINGGATLSSGSTTINYTDQQKSNTPIGLGFVQLSSGNLTQVRPMPYLQLQPVFGVIFDVHISFDLGSFTVTAITLPNFAPQIFSYLVYIFSNKKLY